jgi:hypothetical protein
MWPLRLKQLTLRSIVCDPMQALFCLEALAMLQLRCKPKKRLHLICSARTNFLVQCAGAPHGTATKDITPEMFNKEEGKIVEEVKLRVIYIPANPPSPVPEGSEEGNSPRASHDNGNQNSLVDAVSRSLEEPKEKSSETWSMISKLTEDKASALQQNQKLRQELELLRKEVGKNRSSGVSLFIVFLVGLIGLLVGYWVKKT